MSLDSITDLYKISVNITKDIEGINYDQSKCVCYINIKKEKIDKISGLINLIASLRNTDISEDIAIEIINKDMLLSIEDMSFLENLCCNIDKLHIEGIDLSGVDFSQLKNLKELFLFNCNLQSLRQFVELDSMVHQCLYDNDFDEKEINSFAPKIINRQGKFIITKKYHLLFDKKRIDLYDYLDMKDDFDFSLIEGLEVSLPKDFDFTNVEIIELLKKMPNIKLGVEVEQYKLNQEKIDGLNIPLQILIDNVSQLSTDFVEEHDKISSIRMIEGSEQSKVPYSREDYILVRTKIDEFLKDFDLNDTEVNKAKKLFEKMKDEIMYNYGADLFDDGQKITSRNLYGALVDKKAVCRRLCRNFPKFSNLFGIRSKNGYWCVL